MNLNSLRLEIDHLDDEILYLIKSRMELILSIASEKLNSKTPILDISREKEICKRLSDEAENSIVREFIPKIYSEILKCSKSVQALKKQQIFPYSRVGIIGLGLMGGSIASILKWKSPLITLYGYDRYLEQSVLVDRSVNSLEELRDEVDLIIIASPISSIQSIASQIASMQWNKKLVVWDIASVKQEFMVTFENLTHQNIEFVATHPMSGSTVKGASGSKSTLFAMKPWVICPHKKNQFKTLTDLEVGIHYFGSHPIYMDPEKHDHHASIVSHLPKLLSLSLIKCAEKYPDSHQIVGRGFDLMTSLGKGNKELIDDMITHNHANIKSSLRECTQYALSTIEETVYGNNKADK